MREKKYTEIKNLSDADFSNKLMKLLASDAMTTNIYVDHTYTITTSGGWARLWKVKKSKDETIYTVSSGEIKKIKIRYNISKSLFKHYVLTAKGFNYIKEIMLEEFI